MEANLKVVVKVRPLLDAGRDQACWKVNCGTGEISQTKVKQSKEENLQPMHSQRSGEVFHYGWVFLTTRAGFRRQHYEPDDI